MFTEAARLADIHQVISSLESLRVSSLPRGKLIAAISDEKLIAHSLIANGAALPFTAHATSPTVTMPRVKALTTGSIPSFLDFILNFAESDTTSTLAYQDTWLAQIKAKGGNLVMHGDDTWLKLFPDTFYRVDGTTSFFVSVSDSFCHRVRRNAELNICCRISQKLITM